MLRFSLYSGEVMSSEGTTAGQTADPSAAGESRRSVTGTVRTTLSVPLHLAKVYWGPLRACSVLSLQVTWG